MELGEHAQALLEAAESPAEFTTFEAYSATHWVTLGICLIVITIVVVAGRMMSAVGQGPSPRAMRSGELTVDAPGRMLGVLGLGVWVAIQFYWVRRAVMEGPEQLAQSLPLHVCDLAGLIGAVALISGSRFWTVILYFWGIALSTQAFITPVVEKGPLFTEFWLFWESHTLIVGSAVYVVAVRGYRPTLRDVRAAFVFTFGYGVLILMVNLWQGWNYGYVGQSTPGPTTVIDQLGSWPRRLVPLGGLVALAFVAAWAPWAWLARRKSATG
ncbi:MAG: TIGR02206 family membrane protein [Phycisphaeraceae bacterium]|nr:TIGR02206 family membrane protein [Phycisphaeraceae bacterium]